MKKLLTLFVFLSICLAVGALPFADRPRIGLVLGGGFYLASSTLLHIYNDDPQVIHFGQIRMLYLCVPYLVCGLMDTMVGSLRGIGCSVIPMIVSLMGSCAFRIIWIFTAFAATRSLAVLYSSYPISWAITFSAHLTCFIIVWRRHMKRVNLGDEW